MSNFYIRGQKINPDKTIQGKVIKLLDFQKYNLIPDFLRGFWSIKMLLELNTKGSVIINYYQKDQDQHYLMQIATGKSNTKELETKLLTYIKNNN